VADQQLHAVGIDALGAVELLKAAQAGCDYLVAGLDPRGDLLPP
jgi:hypothetical protein